MSEGEDITYGVNEKHDIDCVVDNLKKLSFISKICLWGRSMGAASILHYLTHFPHSVSAVILDSCYLNMEKIIEEKTGFFNMFGGYLKTNII
jgi:pimeloyl-ACP methyl ester carboxylesterase